MKFSKSYNSENSIKRWISSIVFGVLNIVALIAFVFVLKAGLEPLTGHAATGIYKALSFRGTLQNSNGTAVADDTYNIKFIIYNASTGGTCLYTARGACGSETAKSISVENGLFTTLLGDTDGGDNALTLDFNDDSYWLGVTVGSDSELTPRIRIGAAGYSANADLLDGLNTSSNGGATQFIPATTAFGNLNLTGDPRSSVVSDAVMYINPTEATSTYALFGLAVGGSEQFRVDASGNTFASGTIYSTQLQILNDADQIAMTLISNSTQNANLLEAQNNAGAPLAWINSSGGFGASGTSYFSNFLATANNQYDLGGYENAWRDVYSSGTIRSVSSTITDGAFQDSFGWHTNNADIAKLIFGASAGIGSAVSPGNNFSTTTNWTTYDPGANGIGTDPDGFFANIFDGRYIYFIPSYNGTEYSGEFLRYDTAGNFDATISWATYDPGANGIGTDPDGYAGAVFDGRYLYFTPFNNGTVQHGEVLRYDTKNDFSTSTSWNAYDPGANGVGTEPDGYVGAIFDGRYIYFVPANNETGFHGEVLRYDTAGAFGASDSWTTYDPGANGVGTDPDGFYGAVFDGTYIYFVPAYNGTAHHGEVLRYNTTGQFNTSTSWTTYDPGANGVGTDPDGYYGGIFDGRYIYFSPFHNGTERHGEVLRYDTAGNFEATTSWITYDPGANGIGTDPDGFYGIIYDGRYIYFTPYSNGTANNGEVMQYDTTGSFMDINSWKTFDPGDYGIGTDPDGYYGGSFDGRYIYFAPNYNGTDYHGEVLRFDTGSPTPQQGIAQTAQSMDFFIDSSGNAGVGTTTPLAQFHIHGLSDETQLIVQASSTQTNNLTEWQNSSDGILAWLNSSGGFGASGTSYFENFLSTDNDLYDLGGYGNAWKDVYASGTIYAGTINSGTLSPSINNLYDIGTPSSSWRDIYSSGTIRSASSTITEGAFKDAFGWSTFNEDQINTAFAGNSNSFVAGREKFATSSFTTFNASNINGMDTTGYEGAIFDGRYVYFVPKTNTSVNHANVLRYDTTKDMTATSSWRAYNAGSTDGLDTAGYRGASFDGRYIYFAPYYNAAWDYHGVVLRYDTQGEFTTTTSWDAYNAGTTGGYTPTAFAGSVFDGKYVYFIPGSEGDSVALRYDTTSDFDTASSWAAFDINGFNSSADGFSGGVFDGTYIYYVPEGTLGLTNIIVRYNTGGDFSATSSWESFDDTTLTATDISYNGATFDGRYIYFSPNRDIGLGGNHSKVIRYDTEADFTNNSSWDSYTASSKFGTTIKGYHGSIFDGRYVYFVPYSYGGISSQHANLLRYDTLKDFNDDTSWATTDMNDYTGPDTTGYSGAISDGRYIYFAPDVNNTGDGHGHILRYDTERPSPQQSIGQVARTIDFFIDSSGNAGVGTTTPLAQFHIHGLSDETQLIVQASSTQTNNLTEWQGSDESIIAWIDSSGNIGASGTLTVSTTTFNGAITLHSQTSDPSGTNGMMYYDSGAGRFRCYQAGAWANCIGSGSGGGGGGIFTDIGDGTATLTTSTNRLGIGSSADHGWKVTINSLSAATGTLRLVGASSQTSNLFMIEDSSANSLFWVDPSGNTSVSGTLETEGVFTPTGGISTSTLDGVVIGGTTAAAGSFTTLSFTGSGNLGSGGEIYIDSNDWDISSNGVITNAQLSTSTLDNVVIGGSTAAAGTFTTLATTNVGSDLNPDGNNTRDLGAYGSAWKDVYVSGTIYGGGASYTISDSAFTHTGTTTLSGIINLGDGGDALTINSNTWNVSAAGVFSGMQLSTSTLDNIVIGGTTAAAGTFSTLNATGAVSFNSSISLSTTTLDGALTLDTQTSDPSGANGMMYYDSGTGKFRCYESDTWKDCITTAVGGGSETGIFTDNADGTANLTTSTNRVGIGTAANHSWKLTINSGDASTGTLRLVAATSQTRNILHLENSNGDSLFTIDPSGNTAVSGTLETEGVFTPTGGISTSTLDGVVIGGTTAAAGSFTTLSSTGLSTIGNSSASVSIDSDTWDISVAGVTTNLSISTSTLDGVVIGGTTAAAGSFSSITMSGDIDPSTNNARDLGSYGTAWRDIYSSGTIHATALTSVGVFTPTGGISTSTIDNIVIGGSTAAAGNFTTLNISGASTFSGDLSFTSGGISTSTLDGVVIGGTTAAAGTFDTLFAATTTLNGVLTLDTQSTDPSGANGMMYYDSGTGKFRCYEAGTWKDCITVDVGGGGSAIGVFTDNADGTVNLTTSTNRIGIGTSADHGWKLTINSGDASTGTLRLVGAGSQAQNILHVEGAGGESLFWVSPSGNTGVTGTLQVDGVLTAGGISTSTWDNVTIGAGTAAAGTFTTLTVNQSGVFNDGAGANDFRIESNNEEYMFYLDGTNDVIGMNTSTPISQHVLTIFSDNQVFPGLNVGSQQASTTIAGGEAGMATSTFSGDVVIENLYSGLSTFAVDGGIIDAMNIPVSASSTDGSLQGYSFLIDGIPAMSIVGLSNAAGETRNNFVGIGTMYPSDLLTLSSSTASVAIGSGSTTSTIETNALAIGADSTNQNTGIFYVDSSGNISASGTFTIGTVGTENATSTLYGNFAATGTVTASCTGSCLDIAEQYSSLHEVEAGDVVVALDIDDILSEDDDALVKKSSKGYEKSVVGVVSTNPGLSLTVDGNVVLGGGGAGEPNLPNIALAGRVPVKVTNENGEIKKGDLLVTSALEYGHGMRLSDNAPSGMISVFAMALEDWDPEKAVPSKNNPDIMVGKVLVMIKNAYISNEMLTVSSDESGIGPIVATSTLDFAGDSIFNIAYLGGMDGLWSIDEEGGFTTKGEIVKTIETSDGEKDFYPVYNEDPTIMLSGSGEIINGEARIMFDPALSEIMDPKEGLKVTASLTSTGIQNIYVAEKSIADILVKEVNGGKGTATFDYIIVAKRRMDGIKNDLPIARATSTPEVAIQDETPTSTPEVVIEDETATSTPEIVIEDQTSTSTPEVVIQDETPTSTPEIVIEDETATSTLEVVMEDIISTSTTENSSATSTN